MSLQNKLKSFLENKVEAQKKAGAAFLEEDGPGTGRENVGGEERGVSDEAEQ